MQNSLAATIGLGAKTAMSALKSVDAMDKLGPAYSMARERVNALSWCSWQWWLVGRSSFRLLWQVCVATWRAIAYFLRY